MLGGEVNREAVPNLAAHLHPESVREGFAAVNVQVVQNQMYGLRVPVLDRQLADNTGELESGAIRCREGEVAADLWFHDAENIGRAATLVLAIASRFTPRFGWRGGPNIGMQGNRLLVETNSAFCPLPTF